jgi:hypothetical protein|tara:strand:- start:123 stop:416 length:294 start_codon:yes stop_codon:yes gene_type:complete
MKKFIFILFLLIPTVVFADYILEPANCTLKKKNNCGAYLYNKTTGATYFCDLEKCKEIMPAIEASTTDEVKGSKKSKIPKFKKKKKSKIPKFKKKSK